MTTHQPTRTPDAVVGANIRRLRELNDPEWSQQALADRLNDIDGERGWKDRIVRMERRKLDPLPDGTLLPFDMQKHRSASWPELLSLALVFEVSLYELVLPQDDQTRVTVASASVSEETPSEFPDGRPFPKKHTTRYPHHSDRNELAELLFGLPGNSLTPDNIAKLSDLYGSGVADARDDIKNVQAGLERALATLEELRTQRELSDGE